MKKTLFALVLFATVTTSSAQLAYPGSNWSSLTFNPVVVSGTAEDKNFLLEGKIEQGIVWQRIGEWKLNTYASMRYSADRNGLSYNNKIIPALGVKFQRPWDNGIFEIGVQVAHQTNFGRLTTGAISGTGVQLYVQYWTGWDLKQ